MNTRTRKLVGTIILVAFVCLYALIAMTIAVAKLPDTSALVQLIFFVIAGLIWVLPAGLLIRWMVGPR